MIGKINDIIKYKDLVVPNILLNNYIKLGINNNQLIILIYLINSNNTLYNPKSISLYLNWSLEDVLETIDSLIEKNLLKIELKNNNKITEEHLNLDELYQRIIFLVINSDVKEETTIFDNFEKEFGRTLSPIEYQLINGWKESKISEELILLALKEAVYNGVNNLRYIDRILYEWGKKGIKCAKDVEKDREKYQKRKIEKKELFEYDWLNEEN